MITSKESLFPDFYYFENGRSEIQAAHIVEMLRETDVAILATDAERRKVIASLQARGLTSVMQMIALSEEEILQWKGAGPLFVDVVQRMRNEVLLHPEDIVQKWKDEMRPYVFPDDLQEDISESDDFFGNIWTTSPQIATPVEAPAVAEVNETYPAPSPLLLGKAKEKQSADNDIILLERCILGVLRVLEKRWPEAKFLKSYFIKGEVMTFAPPATEGSSGDSDTPSEISWRYLLNHRFLRPLFRGDTIHGVRLSQSMLRRIAPLIDALRYASSASLDVLTTIRPERFLHTLGLTVLQRSSADTIWTEDYIVPLGEVQRCRHTLKCLISVLQNRVMGCKEKTLKKQIQEMSPITSRHFRSDVRIVHGVFLHHLLYHHQWIEEDTRGFRLSAELLTSEMVRIARIVYDAKGPITTSEIAKRYEILYTEAPKSLNFTKTHRRFPRIKNVARGIWRYK